MIYATRKMEEMLSVQKPYFDKSGLGFLKHKNSEKEKHETIFVPASEKKRMFMVNLL